MIRKLKEWFTDKCPTCQEALQPISDRLCCTKSCAHGHYREETYHHLGVRIIYDK